MDTEDKKAEVLGVLSKHAARLAEIRKDLSNSHNVSETRPRLQRWKGRVVQFLRVNISEEEAERFAQIKEEKSFPDQVTNLVFDINVYQRNIKLLQEEVEDNPYFLSAITSTISPAASGEIALNTEELEASTVDAKSNKLAQKIDTIQDTRNVFVVHGRNAEARRSLFGFLRSIGLKPLEWSQAIKVTSKASPFIGEILDVAFSTAQAVVVLLTPDDEAQLREQFRTPSDPPYESQLTGQARPNVLFEAGMAMGRNPDRTIIVELGTLRPFSDIAGRHTVKLSNDSSARQELAQRLETAGCIVDLSGRDWHTEGNFNFPIATLDTPSVAIKGVDKAAVKVPAAESSSSEYDDDDIISMIAAWLRSKDIGYQGFLVTYSEVDRDLKFNSGITKSYIKAAVSDLGLHVDREGKNTVTVSRRISIA
jgi:predicted nucleotide-binding protein